MSDDATNALADEVSEWLTTGNWQPADLIVGSISSVLAGEVTKELNGSVSSADHFTLEDSFRGHFLCSLLASLACAADVVHDTIPDRAADAINNTMWGDETPAIYSFAVKVTVDRTWSFLEASMVQHMHLLVPGAHAIILARAMAILVCPAPDEHPDVLNCCEKPLENDAVKAVTQDTLKKVIPGWL